MTMQREWLAKLSAAALLPWHAVQLTTHAKSFEANPVIGNPTLNKMGLHMLRRLLADKMAHYRRRKLAASMTEWDLECFAKYGYFIRRQALPEVEFNGLLEEIKNLREAGWEMRQGRTITRRISLDDDVLATHPYCRQVVKDENITRLIEYAASYRGSVTFELQSVIVDPDRNDTDPQTVFHADTFHPTAKAWLFLHDVHDDEGPFAYVPGSHILTPERLAWEKQKSITASQSTEQMHREGSFRISAEEMQSLGLAPPIRFTVPANTLVVADTSGFHARCPSLKHSHRVEIYAMLRRNPFTPWCGGHILALPFIAGRHLTLDIQIKKLTQFAKGSWKAFDKIGAYDAAHL
ncbi:MAG: phytanoyl-CoA dioxygenase family protein [Gammaproteobacteria bacterium]